MIIFALLNILSIRHSKIWMFMSLRSVIDLKLNLSKEVTPFCTGRGAFLTLSCFFVINPFNKMAFILNQLDFESNCIINISRKCEVAKVMESFPILRSPEVTFQTPSIFGPIFDLNDFIKRFCYVTNLT